jgi:muconolactone delta-isomerase
MLFFVNAKIKIKELSPDELWKIWETEAKEARKATEAGKLLAAYKVSGIRRVLGIVEVNSHDELDRILSTLPMARYIEFEEILPIRPFDNFANDLKKHWKVDAD